MPEAGLVEAIQAAFRRRDYRFTEHALQEATADDLSIGEIRNAIISVGAEIVEDYPDDFRGPSCLILARMSNGRPLHIVVSYPPDVAVITVYVPDETRWTDFRTRR